jgi:hypothetical protein
VSDDMRGIMTDAATAVDEAVIEESLAQSSQTLTCTTTFPMA